MKSTVFKKKKKKVSGEERNIGTALNKNLFSNMVWKALTLSLLFLHFIYHSSLLNEKVEK